MAAGMIPEQSVSPHWYSQGSSYSQSCSQRLRICQEWSFFCLPPPLTQVTDVRAEEKKMGSCLRRFCCFQHHWSYSRNQTNVLSFSCLWHSMWLMSFLPKSGGSVCAGQGEMQNEETRKCRKAYLSLPGVLCRMNKTCKSSPFFWDILRTAAKKNNYKATRCQAILTLYTATLPTCSSELWSDKTASEGDGRKGFSQEIVKDRNVLVTKTTWLKWAMHPAFSWEQRKKKSCLPEWAQLANTDCYRLSMLLEEWDCSVKEELTKLGKMMQPRFRDRDIAKGMSCPSREARALSCALFTFRTIFGKDSKPDWIRQKAFTAVHNLTISAWVRVSWVGGHRGFSGQRTERGMWELG